jgi:hypothetical protein
MPTRDSIVWWLGIVGAALLYLSQGDAPTQWTYADWIKAASFAVATVSGKLATSPLKGDGRG